MTVTNNETNNDILMINRKLVQIVSYSLALGLVIFLSFSFYIHQKMTAGLPPGPPMQLSRIDFSESVDSLTAARIKSKVQQMESVKHAYFNIPDGILVFNHDPKVLDADAVVTDVRQHFRANAKRHVVDAEMAGRGCPVTGNNSIFMKVGDAMARIF
ncbi:MAG: hypothetical protein MRY78_16350 [Saprospiraceae bacterium]|nr:hypothetical protein [Saprospiraceae bacterium]